MALHVCLKFFQHFNSIKVRLKLTRSVDMGQFVVFQFHKGTIKTPRRPSPPCRGVPFQFHKGTIKTVVFQKLKSPIDNFNSIKVRLKLTKGAPWKLGCTHFNSIKVRLKLNRTVLSSIRTI